MTDKPSTFFISKTTLFLCFYFFSISLVAQQAKTNYWKVGIQTSLDFILNKK